MKIRADEPMGLLPLGPALVLGMLRNLRGFNTGAWIKTKQNVIESYLRSANLSAVVVGVSGGIDSAIVAGILAPLMRRDNPVLKRLELLCLPSFNDDGVTGQSSALHRANVLANHLNVPLRTIDLQPSLTSLRASLQNETGITAQSWAAGQGVALLRTTALYQTAALLSQEGFPALVVGTTNRDEGTYLGYVGKASDGMVDIQIISDLHKSEVYDVAYYLGLPKELIEVVPTGDMFDACPDTDVFGAPYDAVELLILAKSLLTDQQWEEEQLKWSEEDRHVWQKMVANLTALHGYNAHKYLVRSPAVHLDLMESAMPGGWHPSSPEPYSLPSTLVAPRAALRVLPAGNRLDWVSQKLPILPYEDKDALIIEIPSLLSSEGMDLLKNELSNGPWRSADKHGKWQTGRTSAVPEPDDDVGSWRTTFEDEAFANALWKTLKHYLPAYRESKDESRFDTEGAVAWRPIGVSSVFRVINYLDGGVLVPHYDSPFLIDGRRRTGMSVVIYIDAAEGGDLRFVKDNQNDDNVKQWDFADWSRFPHPHEIISSHSTVAGSAWLFDHRILHDSSPILSGSKMAIRTDIIFEKVGP